MTFFSERYLQEAREIIDTIDVAPIERMVSILVQVREASGRLFFLVLGVAPEIVGTRSTTSARLSA
jgi:hypothetical protein